MLIVSVLRFKPSSPHSMLPLVWAKLRYLCPSPPASGLLRSNERNGSTWSTPISLIRNRLVESRYVTHHFTQEVVAKGYPSYNIHGTTMVGGVRADRGDQRQGATPLWSR